MPVDTTASGRFWLCPVCRKHVASRNDKCQCGFDRTTVNVLMQEAMTPSATRIQTLERDEPRSNLPWVVGLVVALAASLWLWKAGKDSDRANAELRERTAQRMADRDSSQQQQQMPQFVLVPQPTRGQEAAAPPPEPSTDLYAPPAAPDNSHRSAQIPEQAPSMVVVQPQNTDMAANMRAQQEMFWREKAMRAEAGLVSAAAAYVSAVCKEKLGGVPLAGSGTYNDFRNQYVRALADVESLQDSARRGNVPPGWVSMRSNFPPPLPIDVMPNTANSVYLAAYDCGTH